MSRTFSLCPQPTPYQFPALPELAEPTARAAYAVIRPKRGRPSRKELARRAQAQAEAQKQSRQAEARRQQLVLDGLREWDRNRRELREGLGR